MSRNPTSAAVAGVICMTPTAPAAAPARLVDARLLIGLRRDDQPVELVLPAVLLEDARGGAEPAQVFGRARVVQPGGAAQVALDQQVAEDGADPVRVDELVDRAEQLPGFAPDGPGDGAVAADREPVVDVQSIVDLSPERGVQGVGDRRRGRCRRRPSGGCPRPRGPRRRPRSSPARARPGGGARSASSGPRSSRSIAARAPRGRTGRRGSRSAARPCRRRRHGGRPRGWGVRRRRPGFGRR